MSSSLFSIGRLDRKFIQEPDDRKLKYNDPSFVTFRVLFDFEPIVSNDEVMQGLLLNESRDESAIGYLRRMGELERAEALKEFTWMLSRISNDFPWFFKNISGLDGLWKWGFMTPEGSTQNEPITLTVQCYETVDLRMTALADLYRKATRDRRFFRELLTMDKKRFNMTILVGEARNLRTFVDSGTTDWLNHVSAIAFRCLDCEFDFSDVAPTSLDASEAPAQITPSFSIKVHRVQETNSYLLLNYMLGEIKRDLVIKQGGSGAEVNQDYDILNYRSLLAPFVRTYEGNYSRVLNDLANSRSQNFIDQLTLRTGSRVASLPYRQRSQIQTQDLNGISKEGEMRSTADGLLSAIEATASITGSPVSINFGRPTVETEAQESVNLTRADGPKIEDEVANQIEFTKPKVETEISDFSLTKPTVQTQIDGSIGFIKPTVQKELSDPLSLTRPTVDTDQGNLIDLNPPTVNQDIDPSVSFVAPTVQDTLDQRINLERPTVDVSIDSVVSFGRPSVSTEVDARVQFVKPTVVDSITEKIQFEKPKVEDGFGS